MGGRHQWSQNARDRRSSNKTQCGHAEKADHLLGVVNPFAKCERRLSNVLQRNRYKKNAMALANGCASPNATRAT